MTANQMIELMNRVPFSPLEIRLNDGTQIVVEHPWQISTAPNRPICVIFELDEDRTRYVSYRNITEVIVAGEKLPTDAS